LGWGLRTDRYQESVGVELSTFKIMFMFWGAPLTCRLRREITTFIMIMKFALVESLSRVADTTAIDEQPRRMDDAVNMSIDIESKLNVCCLWLSWFILLIIC